MAAITICNDFGAQKIKSLTVPMVSPSICHEVMGLDAMILVFYQTSRGPQIEFFSSFFEHSPLLWWEHLYLGNLLDLWYY